MKILVVGKPMYNYYLPLVDFPQDKDVYNIDKAIESIYGEANVAAYMLGSYGLDVSYTGIIGNDEAGSKFKKVLESKNIDTKFMEVDYESNTDIVYSIIKTEKSGFAKIKVNNMKKDLNKFKYDFTPDYIVIDDKDFGGTNAALNNYPNVPTIFYGDKPTKDAVNMAKRSDYVVCNINFASKITGLEIVLNKPKTIVALYQKLVDLYQGNWVVTLDKHGVIYCDDMQVKMIPGILTTVVDSEKAAGIFFGTFAYSIINNFGIEESVRLANMNASKSLDIIGTTTGFMELGDLLSNRKVKEPTNTVQNVQVQNNQINGQINQNNVQTINVNNQANKETVNVNNQVNTIREVNNINTINNVSNMNNANTPVVTSSNNIESLEVNNSNNVQ